MLKGGEAGTGWLFVTARNVLRNHRRAVTRLTELHRRVTDELDRVPASEEDTRVLEALDRLPERHRDVLLLRYRDGLSTAETGAMLGCAVPTVWVGMVSVKSLVRQANPVPDVTADGLSPRARRELAELVGPAGPGR